MEFLKSRNDWLELASKAGKMDSANVQKEILTNNNEMDYSGFKNVRLTVKIWTVWQFFVCF